MPQFERYFTLEEARAELPRLREELPKLQEAVQGLWEAQAAVAGAVEHAPGNGGSRSSSQLFAHQAVVVELLEAIQARGIQVKDPTRGLVDFPAWRDGEEVLLCWLLGEPDIEYWHDLERGFAGRQAL